MMEVKVGELDAEIEALLANYKAEAEEALKAAVDQSAKELVADIRNNALQQFPNGTGAYAKSWTSKVTTTKRGTYGRIVYAKPPGDFLDHLLEFGHAKVNGGRVEGRPHITPAVKQLREKFPQLVKSRLGAIK